MRLRTVVFASVAALVIVALGVSIGAVALVTSRSARRAVERDLMRSRDVTLELHRLRADTASAECRVVAEEPRLKAVVSTEDVADETVLDVAQSLAASLGSSIFVLTDADGRVVADVNQPDAAGASLADNAVVVGALKDGERAGVWIDPRGPHQVHGCRLAFGQKPVGVLVLGRALDDAMAATMQRQTGAAVAIALDDSTAAASAFPGVAAGGEHAAVAGALARVPASGRAEVIVAGTHYLAAGAPVPDYGGEHRLRYLVFHDIDEALAPGRRLLYVLAGVAGGALLAALALAMVVAWRLGRPIDQLVAQTYAIAAGENARREVRGTTEVRALGAAMNRMAADLEQSRRTLADRERLAKELEIATRIQTSILPRQPALPDLELAALMQPAEEVGGDYYDVIPVPDGGWLAIGDVSGHGLESGLIMMMLQTATATLVRERPDAPVRETLIALNTVIYDNVQRRLGSDRHATLSLLRWHRGGRLTVAGAHLDLIVWRADAKLCEVVPTPGTWIAVTDDIAARTVEHEVKLRHGDVVVLHTDGLTEAMNERGEQWGHDRLVAEVGRAAKEGASAAALCQGLIAAARAWGGREQPADDMTVLAFRVTIEKR